VGAKVWTGSNIAITVWGDDNLTPAVDGIGAGEQMQFRMWRESTNTEYPAQVTYTEGSSTYAAEGIYQLGSLIGTSQVRAKIKVYLQGPLTAGKDTMSFSLAKAGFIPRLDSRRITFNF
jgi:hypothetical protein